jgi:hypothetical protein
MERMNPNPTTTTTPLRAVFESARQFGLGDDQILRTFDETLGAVDQDATVSEYIDELSGALARRILAMERDRSLRDR